MIVRNTPSWFRLLFVWHGSVLPRIWPRLLMVLAVGLVAAGLRHWWLQSLRDSSLSIPTFTLLGVSLAIFLGFRNSVSYDRFWEARKLWGALLIASRSLSRQMLAALGDSDDSRRFIDGVCAFAYALKAQLRGLDAEAQLRRLLPADALEKVLAGRFRPALILAWLGREAQRLQHAGQLSELQWHALDRNLNTLSEILGGCERIASTPMPFTYRVLLNRTITIYCLLLPAGLVTSIGWLTPPIAVFIAYTYFDRRRTRRSIRHRRQRSPAGHALPHHRKLAARNAGFAAGYSRAAQTGHLPSLIEGGNDNGLTIEWTTPPLKPGPSMTLSRLLFSFVSRHWRSYILAALMLATVAVLTVMIPRQVGHIVDALVAHKLSGDALLEQLAWLLGMGLAIYFLRVGWRLQLFSVSYQLGVELRTRLYKQLSRQGPDFFQRQRTGDLMALATNDIDSVEMAAGEAMLAGFDGALSLVLVLAMMTLGVDWRLALAALLPFPFMAWAFSRIAKYIHHHWDEALKRFGKLNNHVQETLTGVRTLRALGLEARSDAELAQLAEAAAHSSFEAQRGEAAFEPVVGVSLVSATAIALTVGGYLVWHGQLTIGALTSFNMYLVQLIWPMFAAGWVLSLLQRGSAAWQRLQPVLDAAPDVADGGDQTVLAPGVLVFDNLTFHYTEDAAAALRQVSVDLPPGRTLGVVGPTGSGKSTLLKLLLRQYPLQQGAIRWDGADIADYRLATLRAAISWVPQEAFLFSATVAENIALARPEASQADIERVARLAAVHEDILRLPKGYQTPVGEKGVALSGGQRQRVAIARALLADAPLLLLDDALSAVDTQTETQILQHLREARRGRSVIIVSHRLSAVADADHIIALHHGHIAEQGSHEQLLQGDGWYASQWRYQQLEASLDAI